MKFKSVANPGPGPVIKMKGKKITLPDQSMSLEEILRRFVRNEPLPVGHDVEFHESEDDLEKVAHMDLVDQTEFLEKQKETQRVYDRQERKRQADRRKQFEDEERAKIAAKVRDEQKAANNTP